MSVPWGVPNNCSKRSPDISVACGRNEKIPPPSLSTTTIRTSSPRPASAVSAPASWTKAMSPTRTTTGRTGRWRARRRSTSRRRSRWHRGWRERGHGCRRTTRGRAPASTRPPPGRASSGSHSATARATPGSLSALLGVRSGGDRRLGPSRRQSATAPATVVLVAPPQPGCERFDARRERARQRHDGRGRSSPGPPIWTTTGSADSEPLGEDPRGRRPSDAHHDVGCVVGGEAVVAQQRVEGRDGVRRGDGHPSRDRRAPATPSQPTGRRVADVRHRSDRRR